MKTVLTIFIIILLLRILVRYQNLKMQDAIRDQERMRYDRMHRQQQEQYERQRPNITVTRKNKKDDGDYIDYEEVK